MKHCKKLENGSIGLKYNYIMHAHADIVKFTIMIAMLQFSYFCAGWIQNYNRCYYKPHPPIIMWVWLRFGYSKFDSGPGVAIAPPPPNYGPEVGTSPLNPSVLSPAVSVFSAYSLHKCLC